MTISTFLGVETALRGLVAQQSAIDVTGHNIANAATPGYSRETADLEATTPFPDTPSGLLGTGVTVASYQRVRDSYLDVQLRAQTMLNGYATAQQNGLNQVQQTLNEPSSTGLSSLLSSYWSAWQNLSNAPNSMATRQALAQSAASLADGFNSLASQMSTIVSQTTDQQTTTIGQVNSIGSQIASLNKSITAAEAVGQTPNDLLDRRDLLIDQLSALGNTSISTTAGTPGQQGSLDITFGGAQLVVGTTANTVTLTTPAPVGQITTNPTSGQLAGMQAVITAINDPTTGYLTQLNKIAASLASNTNTQHAAGTDMNGNAGGAFFTVTAGSEAATLAVSSSILTDPSLIAAGPGTATPANPEPGDGSNALAIADLQQSVMVATGTSPTPNATVDNAYSQLVTGIGADEQEAQQNLDNTSSLVQSLTNQRASVSGVSLDEEMTNLLKYQRGYEASARALTAMDSMLDELINRTGKVGM